MFAEREIPPPAYTLVDRTFDTCMLALLFLLLASTEFYHIVIIITHAFIMCAYALSELVVILNHRCRQSLGGLHGKGVDGLFENVSFQTTFEGVESG